MFSALRPSASAHLSTPLPSPLFRPLQPHASTFSRYQPTQKLSSIDTYDGIVVRAEPVKPRPLEGLDSADALCRHLAGSLPPPAAAPRERARAAARVLHEAATRAKSLGLPHVDLLNIARYALYLSWVSGCKCSLSSFTHPQGSHRPFRSPLYRPPSIDSNNSSVTSLC
jgi:hypothetical protein